MQREIGDEIHLGPAVSLFDNVGSSSAIDRPASNCNVAKGKVKKIRELTTAGKYDADIARYIPGTLNLVFQGTLEDIDTKEKAVHISYKDMDQLGFQKMLTDNYYINRISIHLCFPHENFKKQQRGE